MPQFYQRTESGQTFEIAFCNDLVEIAPDFFAPKLVYLFFKPSFEIRNFNSFMLEDPLVQELINVDGVAFYAGARLVEGWVELYYYTRDSKLLRHILGDKFHASLQHEMGSQPDENWRFFFEKLKPKVKETITIENQEVIDALLEAGDDLMLPHTFWHLFFFSTPSLRDKLKAVIEEKGFQTQEEAQSEEIASHPYTLSASHIGVCTVDAVNETSFFLHDLAGTFHALYEGWNTTLAKE